MSTATEFKSAVESNFASRGDLAPGVRPKNSRGGARGFNWDAIDWRKHDKQIAREIGSSPNSVQSQRRKRGIPPVLQVDNPAIIRARIWLQDNGGKFSGLSVAEVQRESGLRVRSSSFRREMQRLGMPVDRRLSKRITAETINNFYVVNPLSGCWEWTGGRDEDGYGLAGEGNLAHRHSFRLFKGDPTGMFVCHHCDNPPCVNPDHLFLGDRVTNAMDRHSKLRDARGENGGRAKLTELQVREILALAATEKKSHLARIFGVGKTTVAHIVGNKIWRHIPREEFQNVG